MKGCETLGGLIKGCDTLGGLRKGCETLHAIRKGCETLGGLMKGCETLDKMERPPVREETAAWLWSTGECTWELGIPEPDK